MIHHHHFHTIMEKGRQEAIRQGKKVLVSTVFEVQGADLPSLFSYDHQTLAGERFFWSEPGRQLTLAGHGCALLIETDDSDERYQYVEKRWQEAIASFVVDEPLPQYTGPLLFGGFSFDPLRPGSAEWQNFASASFIVPQVMWTSYKGRTWVTLNRWMNPDGQYEDWPYEDTHWTRIAESQHKANEDQYPDSSEKDPESQRTGQRTGYIYKEEIAPSDWMESVREAAESIRDGHIQKVVLARRIVLTADKPFAIANALRKLLQEQDNTYVFAIERGEHTFIGATPERLVKASGQIFQTVSLAGSIARGRTRQEDQQLGDELFHDVKNLHEHALAVDMIRDAMSELCESVQVPDGPILYKLKDIQHLLTPVSGHAREGSTLLQAVEKLHPTPALGGMPQKASLAAIRQLENMDRGWYAAPIGWISHEMDGEFAAAIRSALIKGSSASLYAGCGIVEDSDPLSEYEETALKLRPMLSALGAGDLQV